MKKYISIILVLFAVMLLSCKGASAQDMTTAGPRYGTFWTTAADTLNASDSLQYTIRLKGNHVYNITLGLYVTKVSGTVTNSFVVFGSMDGTNYESTGDTIANANASTGMATYKLIDDFNYPYLMVRGESGATAQRASYTMYYIWRYE